MGGHCFQSKSALHEHLLPTAAGSACVSQAVTVVEAADYESFAGTFDLDARTEEIAVLLKDDPVMGKMHGELVSGSGILPLLRSHAHQQRLPEMELCKAALRLVLAAIGRFTLASPDLLFVHTTKAT